MFPLKKLTNNRKLPNLFPQRSQLGQYIVVSKEPLPGPGCPRTGLVFDGHLGSVHTEVAVSIRVLFCGSSWGPANWELEEIDKIYEVG